jgi:HK97 family phage prohead protease
MSHPKAPADSHRVVELGDIEVRSAEGTNAPRITGTAAVYNRWSQDLGGFKERILPGAFTRTLEGADVYALFNHDANYILGHNQAGTLVMRDSPTGLKVEIDPPDNPVIDALVLGPMRRGELKKMSFAFRTRDDEWREPKKADAPWERDLREVELFDVSIVTRPGYTQTDAALRALRDGGDLDMVALSALLTRATRGLSLTSSDTEFLIGAVSLLRSYLPEPTTPDEGAGETPDEGAPEEVRRSIGHLRALLELEAAHV